MITATIIFAAIFLILPVVEYGVRFTRPVAVPDPDGALIHVEGSVRSIRDDGLVEVDLTVTVDGQTVLAKARECFFGPMRVSVMLDSNGANTTASAAVLSAKKHLQPSPSGRGSG